MTAPLRTLDNLPELLAADMQHAPADPQWRREWAPELSYGRHAGPARADARPAAVAVVLCWDGQSWAIPLTVRSAALSRHGGQVSLPGGLMDPGETTQVAAARELAEELGVHVELNWIGELAPLFVFASNAVVTPCVAAIHNWPEWIPHPPEVDRVLKLGLQDLLNQDPTSSLEIQRGPMRFSAPRLLVEAQSAWGATAVILGELRGRMHRIDANRRAAETASGPSRKSLQ